MTTGKQFGLYSLMGKIAEGAFSEIYRARKDDREFALKKLRNHLKYDHEYTSLLKMEAALLRQVNNHAHFPTFYEIGFDHDEHYLILELIEGFNLEEITRKSFQFNRRPSLTFACQIVLEICKGLEHLHGIHLQEDQPTVHGDLRASNVMLSHRGEVKMIDLGLKGGTFDYMPLERLHDRILSPYTDLFATGHILYELLHGRRLLKGKTKLEAYFEMRDLEIKEELFDPQIHPQVRRVLVKSLNQNPQTRYRSASEMKKDLNEFLMGEKFIFHPTELGKWVAQLNEGQMESRST